MSTPFFADETLNEAELRKQVDRLISAGLHGIFALGTNGENYAMDFAEKVQIMGIVLEQAAHRVPIYIGTGCVTTKETVALSKKAAELGADCLSVVSPWFAENTQEGLYRHFKSVADAVDIPVLIYNMPARTGVNVHYKTMERLSHIENIVGIKDTMVEMSHTRELIKTVKSKIPTFEVYSGFDDNFASNVLAGGDGCIAALSNVVPEVCAAWAQAFRDNDLEGISKGQKTINRLMDLYAIRDPFLPVLKEACKLRGIASSSVGTFPMPNATVEDDAKISLLLSAEGIR